MSSNNIHIMRMFYRSMKSMRKSLELKSNFTGKNLSSSQTSKVQPSRLVISLAQDFENEQGGYLW